MSERLRRLTTTISRIVTPRTQDTGALVVTLAPDGLRMRLLGDGPTYGPASWGTLLHACITATPTTPAEGQ